MFPVEYGFIPRTWFDDGDPLDIIPLSFEPLEVGCIAKVRVIGALIIEDEEGLDAKILSLLENDTRFEGYSHIIDVHQYDTGNFLKPTRGWKNAAEAKKIVNYAMELYRERTNQP